MRFESANNSQPVMPANCKLVLPFQPFVADNGMCFGRPEVRACRLYTATPICLQELCSLDILSSSGAEPLPRAATICVLAELSQVRPKTGHNEKITTISKSKTMRLI